MSKKHPLDEMSPITVWDVLAATAVLTLMVPWLAPLMTMTALHLFLRWRAAKHDESAQPR